MASPFHQKSSTSNLNNRTSFFTLPRELRQNIFLRTYANFYLNGIIECATNTYHNVQGQLSLHDPGPFKATWYAHSIKRKIEVEKTDAHAWADALGMGMEECSEDVDFVEKVWLSEYKDTLKILEALHNRILASKSVEEYTRKISKNNVGLFN
jgi:hypothetical protein